MGRLFGTDGVRGVANVELTPELAFKLGYYGAKVLAKNSDHQPKFVVGMDTRKSGSMLEHALCAGICSAGADVYCCGVIPTPGIAFLTSEMDFDAGVMISASHNPFEFNGIKFFNHKGYKLPDEIEDEIERHIRESSPASEERPAYEKLGEVHVFSQAGEHYLNHLRYALGLDLSGMKLAVDCANGATFELAPKLFRRLGAEVVVIGNTPDGLNINQDCGSTHLQALQELVVRKKCDLGIAFDGDADRMLAIDENGKILDGDVIMAILARYLRAKGKLAKDTLVVTVMSNLGLTIHAKETGLQLATTKVGDRYVLEEMRKNGYSLGGEQSGHFILLDYSTTGDGMLSALALLKALRRSGQKLSEAGTLMTVYPQVLLKTKVPNPVKSTLMEHPELQAEITRVEEGLQGEGRVLVRASGTEPVIRVMLEGKSVPAIQELAEKIVAKIDELVATL